MHRKTKRRISNALSIAIAGVSMGWLIGLSVSPVIQIVTTSIMATTVSIVSALAALHSVPTAEGSPPTPTNYASKPWRVDPLPLATLLFGMVVGSTLGVYGRTHEWLAPSPDVFTRRWSGTGLKTTQIQQRLFNSAFPSNVKEEAKTDEVEAKSRNGVLFAITESDCNTTQTMSPEELRAFLKTVDDPNIKIILSRCNDEKSLKALRSLLCHSE